MRNIRDRLGNVYTDLDDWDDRCTDGVYIGRRPPVFITLKDGSKTRSKVSPSYFQNPYKSESDKVGNMLLKQYGPYIVDKIKKNNSFDKLMELKGKQLGCWCKGKGDDGYNIPCHGDILVFLIMYYERYGHLDNINFDV